MQQPVITPPALPTPAQAPAPTPAPALPRLADQSRSTNAEVYRGYIEQRRELKRQLESLEEKRQDISGRLSDPMVGGSDRQGLEKRIQDIDQRISQTEQAIAQADAQVAASAALPGAVVQQPEPRRDGPPEEVFALGGVFMVIVLLPLSIAFARRIWRRSAAAVSSIPKELMERFTRLEQGVDAIAVEVERIGEGQRYLIGSGAAEPVSVKQREPVASRLGDRD
jgi:hypothetical protein